MEGQNPRQVPFQALALVAALFEVVFLRFPPPQTICSDRGVATRRCARLTQECADLPESLTGGQCNFQSSAWPRRQRSTLCHVLNSPGRAMESYFHGIKCRIRAARADLNVAATRNEKLAHAEWGSEVAEGCRTRLEYERLCGIRHGVYPSAPRDPGGDHAIHVDTIHDDAFSDRLDSHWFNCRMADGQDYARNWLRMHRQRDSGLDRSAARRLDFLCAGPVGRRLHLQPGRGNRRGCRSGLRGALPLWQHQITGLSIRLCQSRCTRHRRSLTVSLA